MTQHNYFICSFYFRFYLITRLDSVFWVYLSLSAMLSVLLQQEACKVPGGESSASLDLFFEMALASLSLEFSICILGFFSPGPSWNSTAVALSLWVNLETIDVFMALSLSSHELLYISVYSRCLRSAVVFRNVLPKGLTQLVFTATMVLALFVFPNWVLPGTGTL